MPETPTVNPVEVVKNTIKALQDQKAGLQKQIDDIDKQLADIAEAAGGTPSGRAPRKPRSGKTPSKAGEYTPEKGSYGAHVLEVLNDGKEHQREAIGKAVKAKLGSKWNKGTFGQAMAKLSKEKVIKSGTKRGNWMLNR